MSSLYTEDTDITVWAVFPSRTDLMNDGVRLYKDVHSANLAASFGLDERFHGVVVEMPLRVCSLEGWPKK